MTKQQRLPTNINAEDNGIDQTDLECTQIKINELSVLAEKTDAIIDRTSEPYIQGTYENATPIKWVKPFGEILGGFDLDPCASETSVLADTNIRQDGGLIYDWSKDHETVWCNPPYDKHIVPKWIKKAIHTNADTVVMLLRGDPSTGWYQDLVEPNADLLFYPEDRITFGGRNNPSNVASLYVVFGDYPAEMQRYCEQNGWVPKPDPTDRTIQTNPDNANELLTETGIEDTVQVHLDQIPTLPNINTTVIDVEPLTKQKLDVTETTQVPCDRHTEAHREFFELTGVYTQPETKEEYFGVILQSATNANEMYFYLENEDHVGFIEYKPEKLQFPPKIRETHSYTKTIT